MEKYTQRQLKHLVESGAAIDITYSGIVKDIPELYTQIGYCAGIYGCSGKLFKGLESGKLYAITRRTTAIYIF